MSSNLEYIRSFRIQKIALFDLISAMAASAWLFKRNKWGTYYQGALAAVPIGIVAHYLLGVNTQLNYYLGLSKSP